jgi:cyclopropane fatty-acyl-phospholipid synthase-like methyltransferase
MLLSKTRRKMVYKLKSYIFDAAKFQEVLDLRDKLRLEDSMGFRGQFDEHRRFQIALLKERGLVPSHRLLEIGCGPLTGGIPIIDFLEPDNYVGVDVRSSVLDLSWKEVGKAGLSAKNPRLICSSSFGATELADQKFDFILSFSVLFHLSNEILASYFVSMRQRLKPTGHCLANVNTETENSAWLEFPFLKRTVEDYRKFASECGLETTSLGELKDLGFRLSGDEQHN